MKKERTLLTLITLLLIGIFMISFKAENQKITEESEISAKLSGAAFVTHDLEASVDFYSNFLEFKETKRMTIDSPTGLAPFGASAGSKLNYVAMAPKEFSKENRNFPGLNFVEIKDAKPTPFSQDATRTPINGEVMKAYSVKGLDQIAKLMIEANVPVITPLGLSATGRSKTLTVIDPNGVRVQMYEFVK